MDTLAGRCGVPPVGSSRDFHPLVVRPAGRTEKKAFSYAFMNASKILNIEGTQIGNTFRKFISDHENLKFIIKEIKLLNPDIVVSANLGDLGLIGELMKFSDIKQAEKHLNNDNRFVYEFEGRIPWIDTWHFSAHKAHFENFYKPVCEAAKILLGRNASPI